MGQQKPIKIVPPNASLQRKRRKIGERRRITAYLVVASIICVGLTFMLGNQKERLVEKQAQQIVVEKQLASVQEQHELLKLQINKLEDDEYIAKLARKDYFLSEEGEIIFTIPTSNSKLKSDEIEVEAD